MAGMVPFAWLPPDPALRLAAWTALGLAAVTLAVLLQVLAVSALATRERRRREAFERRWRPRLAQASITGDAVIDLPAPRGRQRLWWLMLWNRMQRQLRGQAGDRLNALLRALGLDGYALRLLRRPGVRGRLVALETLRHLGDDAHWRAVAPVVEAGNPFVALAAAHALIDIDPPRAMRRLLPVALRRDDWGGQRLASLCRHAGREAVTPALLDALDGADPARTARLRPLLAAADPARIAPWARDCMRGDPDPRNRQAAVQALGELTDPRDHALLAAMLVDDDPGVRLAAVDALARQGRADDVDVLVPLLADRSWWVRRRAADTLVALPRISEAQLQALVPAIEDRYGREALARALAERNAEASP
ncbi:HEAT repeat domain-containing protein [Lysobacter humi (ex Lee et al. 2017)]